MNQCAQAGASSKSTTLAQGLGFLLILGLLLGLVGCSSAPDTTPGSNGQACNSNASGTDGCNATTVCVVEDNVCRPDCSQVSCEGGSCSPYYSPHEDKMFSVCFPAGQSPPPVTSGNGSMSGGCGAATPYCANWGICIDPNCPFWCGSGTNLHCDTSASPALRTVCAGATVHDGCDAATSNPGPTSNGCPADNPIACPNNLCCPTQFPQCGGSCGQNCCSTNTTTNPGTGGGTCAGGCTGGSVCVNLGGTGVCEPECTSSSQCSTGCCAMLSGTSTEACLPASSCSATTPGTGPSSNVCADESSCLVGQVNPFTSGCEANGYHFTVTNHCAKTVQYEYCFQHLDGSCDCGEGTVAAGQTLSSIGDYTCDSTGHIRYTGIDPSGWGMCPVLNQCN
ncbi:MAG TPA: hypothetical protein VNW92_21470 [Polyangiaceae bacterium]|nr:hypothetical protein [Polyangiaceae bacterium]